jgi:hypothetical protein
LVIVKTKRVQIDAIDSQNEAKHEKVAVVIETDAIVEPT